MLTLFCSAFLLLETLEHIPCTLSFPIEIILWALVRAVHFLPAYPAHSASTVHPSTSARSPSIPQSASPPPPNIPTYLHPNLSPGLSYSPPSTQLGARSSAAVRDLLLRYLVPTYTSLAVRLAPPRCAARITFAFAGQVRVVLCYIML